MTADDQRSVERASLAADCPTCGHTRNWHRMEGDCGVRGCECPFGWDKTADAPPPDSGTDLAAEHTRLLRRIEMSQGIAAGLARQADDLVCQLADVWRHVDRLRSGSVLSSPLHGTGDTPGGSS